MLSLRELFPRYCCRLFDMVEQLNAASESASGSSPGGGGVGPGAPGPAGGSARRPATATMSPADSAADSLLPTGSIMTRIPSPSPHDDLPGPIQVERRHHEEPCSGPGEPQPQTESPSHLPQAATVSGIPATSSCESASQFVSHSVGDADAPLGAPLARRDTVTESLPLDSASPPACAVTVADLNPLPDASTAASTVRASTPVTSSPLAVGTTSGMMLQDEGAPVSGTGFHGASGRRSEGAGTFVAPHRLGSNSNGEPALAALMPTPPPTSPSPSGPSSPSRKRPRSSSLTTSGSCLTCGSSMAIAFTEGGTLPEKVRALQASAGCSATPGPAQILGFGLDPGRDSLDFSELCQLDAAAPSGVSAQCNAPNLGSQGEAPTPSPSPGRRLRVHRIAALRRLLVEHALLFARTCSAIPMCRLRGKFIVISISTSALHGKFPITVLLKLPGPALSSTTGSART